MTGSAGGEPNISSNIGMSTRKYRANRAKGTKVPDSFVLTNGSEPGVGSGEGNFPSSSGSVSTRSKSVSKNGCAAKYNKPGSTIGVSYTSSGSTKGLTSPSKVVECGEAPPGIGPAAPVKERPPVVSRKFRIYKAELCKFFGLNACTRGSLCTFAHDESEIREYPDMRRSRLCKAFMTKGSCSNGDKCNYAHGQEELKVYGNAAGDEVPQTEGLSKPALCGAFQKGVCPLTADQCRFAHDVCHIGTKWLYGDSDCSTTAGSTEGSIDQNTEDSSTDGSSVHSTPYDTGATGHGTKACSSFSTSLEGIGRASADRGVTGRAGRHAINLAAASSAAASSAAASSAGASSAGASSAGASSAGASSAGASSAAASGAAASGAAASGAAASSAAACSARSHGNAVPNGALINARRAARSSAVTASDEPVMCSSTPARSSGDTGGRCADMMGDAVRSSGGSRSLVSWTTPQSLHKAPSIELRDTSRGVWCEASLLTVPHSTPAVRSALPNVPPVVSPPCYDITDSRGYSGCENYSGPSTADMHYCRVSHPDQNLTNQYAGNASQVGRTSEQATPQWWDCPQDRASRGGSRLLPNPIPGRQSPAVHSHLPPRVDQPLRRAGLEIPGHGGLQLSDLRLGYSGHLGQHTAGRSSTAGTHTQSQCDTNEAVARFETHGTTASGSSCGYSYGLATGPPNRGACLGADLSQWRLTYNNLELASLLRSAMPCNYED